MNPRYNGPDSPSPYDHDFEDETDQTNCCKVCGQLLPWPTIANDDERICSWCALCEIAEILATTLEEKCGNSKGPLE